jgi:GNAT superfamily N-acetyltransferase
MLYPQTRGRFEVDTVPDRLDVDAIHNYLTRSYWAEGISRDTVARSLAGSLCFGLYEGSRQIGLARVITDRATFAYLCDVYVLEHARGRGLGQWLVATTLAHPALAGLRRFMLATRDAHALYARHGFTALRAPERMMEILRPDLYRQTST